MSTGKVVQTALAIKNKKTGHIYVSTVSSSLVVAWSKFDTLRENCLDNFGPMSKYAAINVRIEELTDEPIVEEA